ncbi:hypothetical protein FIBSPDRAFT_951163 [Athelia psychrophila]|uniref:Uncharacterized protein n=1 Tax=Athelia psychrophila TaxID=1759441 RepID=A0A166MWI6_9AGAM|nr:hypothetical protein FIBSPDRAFT_951163 [Fibularhizoctonia sp. CBS 109695]
MHIEVHIVGDATETGPPVRTTAQLAAAVFQKVAELVLFTITLASLDITLASMTPHKAAVYDCASLLKTPPRTSVSPLSSIVWPEGRGARVDAWLSGVLFCVGTEVYSLLAKIVVVRGRDLGEATQRAAWIGRRESIPGGDLGIAGNAAWRDIPSRLIPAWIQRHLRREEAYPDTRLHRVQRLSHTSLRHASKHVLARVALKQGQSPASVSAGAFDLADPNDGTQVAAPLKGKIVELHLAV